MRLKSLFAVVAPVVLLLPLSAHADWPKGEREKYMAPVHSGCDPANRCCSGEIPLRLRS